jgi:hypothetical protein
LSESARSKQGTACSGTARARIRCAQRAGSGTSAVDIFAAPRILPQAKESDTIAGTVPRRPPSGWHGCKFGPKAIVAFSSAPGSANDETPCLPF